jgi:hypothetical protein
MRALSVLLGLVLVALLAGPAAAQTGVQQQEATPQWDIKAQQSPQGNLSCYYYPPGTITEPQEVMLGPQQQRQEDFAFLDSKWPLIEQAQRFSGLPVVREQALRAETTFAAPAPVIVGTKWNYFEPFPQSLYPAFEPAAPPEELGRGAMTGVEEPRRPPTYIAQDQHYEPNVSRFESVEGQLCLRPDPPSPLQQLNSRQFGLQWKSN